MGRLRKNYVNENKLFSNDFYFIKDPKSNKGNWSKVFKNKNPIEIEIGCGKGLFIVSKAIKNPNINYIAIDKFATVLFQVLKKIEKYNSENNTQLQNIKIISIDAKELQDCFANKEIDQCYLNFSDPWPKKKHEKNRLTNISFLTIYDAITKDDALVEFKTDNDSLFEYSEFSLKENNYKIVFITNDLYSIDNNLKDNFPTEYELKWSSRGTKIKKITYITKNGSN